MQESRLTRAATFAALTVAFAAGCGGGGGGGGGSGSSLAPIQTGTNPPGTNPPGTNPPGTNPPGTTPGTAPTPLAVPSGPVGGKRVEGVDVSYHNGTIDWKKVQAAGIGFAFIRVSDGLNLVDPQFTANWNGAKSVDIVRGVYQYFRGSQSGVSQANLLLSKIGTQGATDLQPVCDIEELDGVSASTLVARVRDWMSTIQSKTGVTPIIYTSPAFWNSLNTSFPDNDLWVAHWGVSAPTLPNGWAGWNFWQYTDSGTVSGISGAVDRNVFQGTLADLRAFAGIKAASGFFRGVAVNSTGKGGWLASTDGGVFQHGDA
ncbi:MAG: GH25 family lysozyme, partial [Planctomycetota bacterium]